MCLKKCPRNIYFLNILLEIFISGNQGCLMLAVQISEEGKKYKLLGFFFLSYLSISCLIFTQMILQWFKLWLNLVQNLLMKHYWKAVKCKKWFIYIFICGKCLLSEIILSHLGGLKPLQHLYEKFHFIEVEKFCLSIQFSCDQGWEKHFLAIIWYNALQSSHVVNRYFLPLERTF